MPPEALDGISGASYQSDIWAIGCILHEMITGKIVFKSPIEEKNTLNEVEKRVMTEQPSRLPAYISRELRNLILRMMLKAKYRRPSAQQISEMALLKGYYSTGLQIKLVKPKGIKLQTLTSTIPLKKEENDLATIFTEMEEVGKTIYDFPNETKAKSTTSV